MKAETYYESLDILARMHRYKGDVARAERCRRSLSPNEPPSLLQPLNSMDNAHLCRHVDTGTKW
jgi:hypothetical protein